MDEPAFGVDARPHWLALEPGGKRIVMTGGGILAGGVYLIDVDEEQFNRRLQPRARGDLLRASPLIADVGHQ